MKKSLFKIICMVLTLTLVAQFTLVSAATKVDTNKEDAVSKIYKQAKESKLISLASDNTIIIDNNIYLLDYSKNDIDTYINKIKSSNNLVKKGIGYYNDQLDFQSYSVDVIQENAHNKKSNINTDNMMSPLVSDYPNLYAYTVAQQNKAEIASIFNDLVNSGQGDSAYSFTVGYWIGSVAPGGPWDYKVTSLGPWNRMWTMNLKYSSLIYANTEWFGNYNFGLTGSLKSSISRYFLTVS